MRAMYCPVVYDLGHNLSPRSEGFEGASTCTICFQGGGSGVGRVWRTGGLSYEPVTQERKDNENQAMPR